MHKKILSLGFFVGAASFFGLGNAVEMDPHKVIALSISKKGPTRVSIDGDVIQDVFARPVEAKDALELHKTGHLLVIGEGLKSSVYLTLFTRKGTPQDLILTPTDKDLSPIILQEAGQGSAAPSEEDKGAHLLAAIAKGEVPDGFFPKKPQGEKRLLGEAEAVEIRRWTSTHQTVLAFELLHEGEGLLEIKEPALFERGDGAIYLKEPQLEPGQKTLFYVLKNNL